MTPLEFTFTLTRDDFLASAPHLLPRRAKGLLVFLGLFGVLVIALGAVGRYMPLVVIGVIAVILAPGLFLYRLADVRRRLSRQFAELYESSSIRIQARVDETGLHTTNLTTGAKLTCRYADMRRLTASRRIHVLTTAAGLAHFLPGDLDDATWNRLLAELRARAPKLRIKA